jgi:hypothetical protein
MTLTQDVATHWNNCLDVNSSWRQFTHELAILNTFDCLHIEDVEFVADLMLDNELFKEADFNELQFACFEFAAELEVEPEDIDCSDLANLAESGLTLNEVVELATEKGVPAAVINDFALITGCDLLCAVSVILTWGKLCAGVHNLCPPLTPEKL